MVKLPSQLFLICLLSGTCLASEQALSLHFDFERGGLSFQTDDRGFIEISSPDLVFHEPAGHPDLPASPLRVALPPGTRATGVRLVDAEYEELSERGVVAPAPILVFGGGDLPADPDPAAYSQTGFIPDTGIRLMSSGTLLGFSMAYLEVSPVRWDPGTGEMEVLRSLDFEIDLSPAPGSIAPITRSIRSENGLAEMVRSIVCNPGDVMSSGSIPVEPWSLEYGEYVIITPSAFSSSFQVLADWKTRKGIPATVWTREQIEIQYPCWDVQQSIRAFLTDCRDEGVVYVLLAGDHDMLPGRYVEGFDDELILSDLYFADNDDAVPGEDLWDLDGDHVWGEPEDSIDAHPDFWVGRASVNSVEEADIFVEKVLLYEHVIELPCSNGFFEDSPPEERIGFTTGYLDAGGTNPGSEYAEQVSALVPGSWEQEKCYEDSNSTAMTIEMLNAAPHHVFHANHGAPTMMYTAYGDLFTVDQILQLQNVSASGHPAIWNSIACSIGRFDTLTCCADAWLNAPSGGGFCRMNSGPSFASTGTEIIRQFYVEYFVNGIAVLGAAHGISLDFFQGSYLPSTKRYNLFGDPEVTMWMDEGPGMSVSCPDTIIGNTGVDVWVAGPGGPVGGARVCLQKGDWKTGDIYVTGTTDAFGHANLWVEPESTGEMLLTVWSAGFVPFLGSICVAGTGIEEGQRPPVLSDLGACPSPAGSTTSLSFSLDCPGYVALNVYDLAGRRVATVAEGEFPAGESSVQWNLSGADGPVSSGIYFAVASTGSGRLSASLVVLR